MEKIQIFRYIFFKIVLCMSEKIVFVASICKNVGDIAINVSFKGPKETGAICNFCNFFILLVSDSDYFAFAF